MPKFYYIRIFTPGKINRKRYFARLTGSNKMVITANMRFAKQYTDLKQCEVEMKELPIIKPVFPAIVFSKDGLSEYEKLN